MLLLARAQQLKASLLALLSLGQVKAFDQQHQSPLLPTIATSSSSSPFTTTTAAAAAAAAATETAALEADPQRQRYSNSTHEIVSSSNSLGSLVLRQLQVPAHNNGKFKYAVVVDCGSSGTRGHIFTWPQATPAGQLPNQVRPMLDPTSGQQLMVRIQPGLSSLKDRPEEASDYMKPVMEFISKHVPPGSQPETPVYFLGTAGMRLLPPETQEEILDDIAHDLRLEYNFPNIFTKVISGVSEGVYQWLSINAYSNRLSRSYDLEQESPVLALKDFFCQSPRTRRFGMLEIGGASAQVTFDTTPVLDFLISGAFKFSPEALGAYERSRFPFSFANPYRRFNLFSTTFLGLGTNSARAAAVDLLVRDSTGLRTVNRSRNRQWPRLLRSPLVGNGFRRSTFGGENSTLVIEDPCLPVGGSETFTKPVRLVYDLTKTIGFTVQANEATFTVRLVGLGNYKMCRILSDRVLNLAREEHLNCLPDEEGSSCSSALIGTSFVPWKFFQFLGLSELFYTTDEMLHASGPFNPHKVLKRTIQICSTPFDRLNMLFPDANRVDKKRVLRECFKATWLLTWLQNGLRMPMLFGADLKTIERIDGNELDWTLGALLTALLQ